MLGLCPPESWALVVERAVQDAQAGDAKARDWLTRYLLPAAPVDAWIFGEPDDPDDY